MVMNETTLTMVGNLTEAPELRYLPSGAARAGFTVASTPRRFDRQAGAWVEALFLRGVAWGPIAEHAAESLSKGDRVVAVGRLRQRSFETAEGQRRQVIELEVDELGVSLRYATARPEHHPSRHPCLGPGAGCRGAGLGGGPGERRWLTRPGGCGRRAGGWIRSCSSPSRPASQRVSPGSRPRWPRPRRCAGPARSAPGAWPTRWSVSRTA